FLEASLAKQYYDHFSPQDGIFELILVGLDGTEKFRARNMITPPSVLINLIDGMPMRRRELLEGQSNKSKIANDGGR
ncbi:MAG: DUF4174 domain-containing protein, partial [Bacteroidota bacterium]